MIFGFTDEQWACYTQAAAAAASAARSLDQADRLVEELQERGFRDASPELDRALRDRQAAEETLARLDRDCGQLEGCLSADLTAATIRQRLISVQEQLHGARPSPGLRGEFHATARLYDRARQRDAERASRAEQLAEFCR